MLETNLKKWRKKKQKLKFLANSGSWGKNLKKLMRKMIKKINKMMKNSKKNKLKKRNKYLEMMLKIMISSRMTDICSFFIRFI